MVRTKNVPVKAWCPPQTGSTATTMMFTEQGMDLSDNENDAEFDEAGEHEEFRHPLDGHPDIGQVSMLQNAIAEVIFSSTGGDSSGLPAIQNAVAKKFKSLKRRDNSEYPSQADLKKAVVEALRPNPRVPNLFRKEEAARTERYRCNVTEDEAVESMRKCARLARDK